MLKVIVQCVDWFQRWYVPTFVSYVRTFNYAGFLRAAREQKFAGTRRFIAAVNWEITTRDRVTWNAQGDYEVLWFYFDCHSRITNIVTSDDRDQRSLCGSIRAKNHRDFPKLLFEYSRANREKRSPKNRFICTCNCLLRHVATFRFVRAKPRTIT